jgi:hypothetical protein
MTFHFQGSACRARAIIGDTGRDLPRFPDTVTASHEINLPYIFKRTLPYLHGGTSEQRHVAAPSSLLVLAGEFCADLFNVSSQIADGDLYLAL